jgi:hypothetical protein
LCDNTHTCQLKTWGVFEEKELISHMNQEFHRINDGWI